MSDRPTNASRSVLVIGNNYPPHTLGGYEILCRDQVAHLRAGGAAVTVLTSTYGVAGGRVTEETGAAGERIVRGLDFHWRDYEHVRPTGSALWRGELRQRRLLEHALGASQPDVAQVWHMAGVSKSLLAVLAAHRVPAVAVVEEPWPVWDVEADHWLRMWRSRAEARHRALARAALRPAAARLVAPVDVDGALAGMRPLFCSAHLRDTVESRLHAWRGRGVVAHNGIDLGAFRCTREPDAPLHDPVRLLYLGRVERRKGVRTAVEALGRLRDMGVPARLTVAGWEDETFAAELRALADDLDVARCVDWVGPVDRADVADTYAAHDVLVFPTTWDEPFGLVPLEAMATGCLVTGTGTGGSGEFMLDGVSALLFAKEDATGLAVAVRRMRDDPDLVERLRRGGLAVAAEHDAVRFHDAVASLAWEAAAAARSRRSRA